MTRGVALCLRGNFGEASRFNPLALTVLLLAGLLVLKWAIELASGRRFDLVVSPWVSRVYNKAVLFLLLINWIYLVIYRREDPFASTWLGEGWAMFTNAP
jgi:hypothetical protein